MAKKKAASVNETASVYIANVTIRHDGDRYLKGEEIDLTPTEAAELLAAGSISPKLVPVKSVSSSSVASQAAADEATKAKAADEAAKAAKDGTK